MKCQELLKLNRNGSGGTLEAKPEAYSEMWASPNLEQNYHKRNPSNGYPDSTLLCKEKPPSDNLILC